MPTRTLNKLILKQTPALPPKANELTPPPRPPKVNKSVPTPPPLPKPYQSLREITDKIITLIEESKMPLSSEMKNIEKESKKIKHQL